MTALILGLILGQPPKTNPIKVEEYGKGQPLVLIPGLACGGSVWDGVVKQLEGHFHLYVLTLPGFAGQPPITDRPYLPAVKDDVEALIKEKRMKSPIIVGHSLGGFLAWWIAADEPKEIKAIVAVDGLPFLSALSNPAITPQQAQAASAATADQMGKATPEAFKSQILQALAFQITDKDTAKTVGDTCVLSDQSTVAAAFSEMMDTDLRPKVGGITCPALLMMSGAFDTTKQMQQKSYAAYFSQIQSVKEASLVPFPKARHFIFLDDPKIFITELVKFLDQVDSAKR